MMNREQRALLAKETLGIFNSGSYCPDNQYLDIKQIHEQSIRNSKLYSPDELYTLTLPPPAEYKTPDYLIINKSVVTVIHNVYKSTNVSPGVLNFASAKNPGGGFLQGSKAQEENLAMCSNLYFTLIENAGYYQANKSTDVTSLYTDYMIYSPGVVFIRDNEKLTTPFTANIITAPAVNMGAYLQKGGSRSEAEIVMKKRMRLILNFFAFNNTKDIILGAYGCGVFKNDPKTISVFFYDLLIQEKLENYFNKIIFAIYDSSTQLNVITPFADTFSHRLHKQNR